jgi:hypothetical protein
MKKNLLLTISLLFTGFLFLSSDKKPAREDRFRTISTKEYQFALTIFEREFPPRDQITITNITGLGGRPYVRPTVDGNIRINIGDMFDNPMAPGNINTFVHELTHAWQIEHYGLVWFGKEALNNQVLSYDAYTYNCDVKNTLSDYNAEQQGNIVRDYYKKMPCPTTVCRSLPSKTWKLLIGSDGRDMTVDENGTYWLVNSAGIIYRYNVAKMDWDKMPGSDGLSIAANAGKVCLVNTAGKIYQWNGGSWSQMPGSDGRDVAINNDGLIWMTNSAGKIYRYNGSSWNQMPGSDGRRIGAGGGQVWLVNSVGKIYQWNGSSWTQKTGSDGRDITVSNEGKVFLTNSVGNIYEWNATGWTQLDGSDGTRVAANNGTLTLVNTKGRLYYRAYGNKKIPIKVNTGKIIDSKLN